MGTSQNYHVRASSFGIVGNTPNVDLTLAFRDLGNWLRAHDRATIVFDRGTYLTQSIDCFGVAAARFYGNGAKFSQPVKSYTGNRPLIRADAAYAPGYDRQPFGGWAPNGADLIATVAAGASRIQLKTPSAAAKYPAGSQILIYGYDNQNGHGYPVNARYYEYDRIVTASNPRTGILKLQGRLRYAYNDKWHRLPAQIFNLSQVRKYSPGWYEPYASTNVKVGALTTTLPFCTNLEFYDFDFSDCNIIYTCGRQKYVNCKFPTVNITNYSEVTFSGCDFTHQLDYDRNPVFAGQHLDGIERLIEIDKLVGKINFIDCDLGYFIGSQSCEVLNFKRCRFHPKAGRYPVFMARSLTMSDCFFHKGYILKTPDFFFEKATLINNKFYQIDNGGFSAVDCVEAPLVLEHIDVNERKLFFTTSKYQDLLPLIGKETILFNLAKNYALRILDIEQTGAQTVIKYQLKTANKKAIATGDRVFWYRLLECQQSGNQVKMGQNTIYAQKTNRQTIEASYDFVNGAPYQPVWIDGFVTKVVVDVSLGSDNNARVLLVFDKSTTPDTFDYGFGNNHEIRHFFSGKIGRRYVSIKDGGGVNGNDGSDSGCNTQDLLLPIPYQYCKMLTIAPETVVNQTKIKTRMHIRIEFDRVVR
jgi:hypothetical protein